MTILEVVHHARIQTKELKDLGTLRKHGHQALTIEHDGVPLAAVFFSPRGRQISAMHVKAKMTHAQVTDLKTALAGRSPMTELLAHLIELTQQPKARAELMKQGQAFARQLRNTEKIDHQVQYVSGGSQFVVLNLAPLKTQPRRLYAAWK